MWGLAGQSGFLYDFDVCQGPADPEKERSDVGVSGDDVLKLTSTLPGGKNHKVFADNYLNQSHCWNTCGREGYITLAPSG